jgi:hypothetical protein
MGFGGGALPLLSVSSSCGLPRLVSALAYDWKVGDARFASPLRGGLKLGWINSWGIAPDLNNSLRRYLRKLVLLGCLRHLSL